jgi:hypothetical protein
MMQPNAQRAASRSVFGDYWVAYGGWPALSRSAYFHVSAVGAVLLAPFLATKDWWDIVIQVLPNIVGFSIGGYAIWLGFGDEKFKALMSERESGSTASPYMEVSATFCHFVIIQLAAILFAMGAWTLNFDASQSWPFQSVSNYVGMAWRDIAVPLRYVGATIGGFLFLYALATAMAAVLAIFEIAQWFDRYRSMNEP